MTAREPPPVLGTVRLIVGRAAAGSYFRLDAPLSLWGGLDPESATITDRTHPQLGTCLSHRAVHLPTSRGSSSSSSVLLECVRRNNAPTLILIDDPDLILTIGAAAAWELYGRGPTVAVVEDLNPPTDGTQIICTAAGLLINNR